MPMRLDHDERRSQLAAAVWRIVCRDGVSGASVRGVAREAGLSMGSVRYFFSSQDQLLQFALREVIETVRARIQAGAPARAALMNQGRTLDAVLALIEQVLPLDDERRIEARVWAAFTGQSATQPAIAAIRQEADNGVRQLCHDCLAELAQRGYVDSSRDATIETERLWALLDGLTMHILLEPSPTTAPRAMTLLRAHLSDLATPQHGIVVTSDTSD